MLSQSKIREENLRSLGNLNSYIDSVSQLRPTEARLLRFYIAEKSNQKSKRYYSFEVELPAVQRDQGIDSSKAGQLMNHVAETLNAKFMESRGIRNPHLRKKDQPEADSSQPETDQQKKERMEAELRPIKKRSVLVLPTQDYKKELFQERLKRKADELYVQSEKDELLGQLQKKVSFANTPANKPLMWSRIALKQSGLYKDYQRILEDLIDPRLIYFDSALTQGQIDECTNRVMELSRGCCRAAWTSSCRWTGRSWWRSSSRWKRQALPSACSSAARTRAPRSRASSAYCCPNPDPLQLHHKGGGAALQKSAPDHPRAAPEIRAAVRRPQRYPETAPEREQYDGAARSGVFGHCGYIGGTPHAQKAGQVSP
jgi:hypothetical protein